MANTLVQIFASVLLGLFAYGQAQQTMIQLERDLSLSGDHIGLVQGINVDKRGRIYIGDIVNAKIHLYSATGEYLRAIGRRGPGPAEFAQIGGSQLTPEDWLYVLDGNLRRVTLFRSDEFQTPVRTFTVPGGPQGEAPSMTGSIKNGHSGLWVTPKNQLFIGYSIPFSPATLHATRYFRLFQVDSIGRLIGQKPVVQVPDRQWLVLEGRGFSVSLMPFASRPVIYLGPSGHIYYGHTDDLSISIVDVSGRMFGKIQYPVKRIKLTSEMWTRELQQWPDRSLTMEKIKRSRSPVPEYLPAFEDFVVDDQERIWVAVNTDDRQHYKWLVFNKEGKLMADLILTNEVMLKLVKNGYAYGIQTTRDGLQSAVRYRVIEKNQP
jgi:hypothetical protein